MYYIIHIYDIFSSPWAFITALFFWLHWYHIIPPANEISPLGEERDTTILLLTALSSLLFHKSKRIALLYTAHCT